MRRRRAPALLMTVLTHVAVTTLSVAIALSLPTISRYILFSWWPRAQASSPLLFASEVVLASLIVSLFIGLKSVLASRHSAASARLASLVHATPGTSANSLDRWREKALLAELPASRDLSLLCISGRTMFSQGRAPMRAILDSAYELRVLMLNPFSRGAQVVTRSRPDASGALAALKEEAATSIAQLSRLREAGKKVTLRLYEHAPFWRLAIHGGHVWVRYCHAGRELEEAPEYVFALHPDDPRHGLFVPFHMHFLNQWNNAEHAEYDFDRTQLVFRDNDGAEVTRRPFALGDRSPARDVATNGSA